MPIKLIPVIFAVLAVPHFAHATDQDANAVYERMQAAYVSLDATKLETVYSPDATYLPRSPKADVNNREAIRRGLSGFINKVSANKGSIKVSFRIVERKRFDGIFIDNGYVRSSIDYGDGNPPVLTYGKFQTAIVRQPDGQWAFLSDSDSETPSASYEHARPLAGVKFDDRPIAVEDSARRLPPLVRRSAIAGRIRVSNVLPRYADATLQQRYYSGCSLRPSQSGSSAP